MHRPLESLFLEKGPIFSSEKSPHHSVNAQSITYWGAVKFLLEWCFVKLVLCFNGNENINNGFTLTT